MEHALPAPPVLLASDGVRLFWIDGKSGLWTDTIAGGAPKQLATGALGTILALDSANVFFAMAGGFASIPKQGGATSTLITVTGPVYAATVAAGTVYWAGEASSASVLPALKSAPLVSGAPVTTLGTLTFLPTAVAVSGATIFAGGLTGAPILFEADAGSTPLDVTGCTNLFAGTSGVYCAGSPLVLVGSDGTTTTQIAAETENATHFALDATNVYWTNNTTSGSVMTAPKGGGTNVTIASDVDPLAIAVDDGGVSWSDNAGNLQRAAKQ